MKKWNRLKASLFGLMSLGALNGFAGLEITDEGLVQLSTKLPSKWKKLKISAVGRDQKTYIVESN